MKLRILNVRFGLVALFVINVLLFNGLYAQSTSFCQIGAGMEPDPKTEVKSTSHVAEVFSPYFTRWNQLNNLKFSDDRKATIALSNINRSRQILGNNFKFQIPTGATIQGISLIVEGQSDGFNKIDELQIQLTGMDGEPKGSNIRNNAKLQKAWSQSADGKDHTWVYGSSSDTWGAQWTAEEINDPNFGFQIQIRNIVNDTVRIEIDQVYIVIDYLPAYSFCDDKCLTFHVDKFEKFGSYEWDYPLGFELVSKSIYNQTIDLKITTAEFGLYTLCVDIFDFNGNYVERCCREFLYQDCNSSQIAGMAWMDLNDNQMRDGGEGILSNVPLVLYTENGVPIDTVLTDQFGKYVFNQLVPGKYYIKAPTFNDKRIIPFNAAINPDNNSDVTNAFGIGTTSLITVEIGKTVEYIDFGYTPLVSVGDFVWNDRNFNGLQDTSEVGIGNIKVKIFRQNGVLYDSTYTDVNGKYKFENIPGNKYYLIFEFPTGLYPTFTNSTSTTSNSKINNLGRTPLYTFTNPSFYQDVDAGFYQKVTIGDLVWEDKNGNGIYDDAIEQGLSGVSISLSGVAGNGIAVSAQTITDGNGRYLFDDLLPGIYTLKVTAPGGYHFTIPNQGDDTKDSDAIDGMIENISIGSGDFILHYDVGLYRYGSIGDFVWNDLNGDGIQQADEPGIANVELHLIEFFNSDTFYVTNTLTNSDGRYTFNSLKPGQYLISIALPDGFEFTSANKGTDDKDSDAISGEIDNIMLMSGENNATFDIGMYNFGSIGDFVWEDLNGNGIQDIDEPGLSNVIIELSGNTSFGNNVSYNTITDANGQYLFDFLEPGDYTISVSLLNGYVWTVSGLGNDVAVDADGFDGVLDIQIGSGTKISDIDFGMYRLSSIGDFVWEDMNGNGIQDTDEAGIANVNMILEGIAGDGSSIILNTTSDQTGFYLFDNIPPGNFTLTIDVPDTYLLTAGLQGSDRSLDSDFDGDNKISVNLQSGQNIQSYDAGLVRNISIGDFVWHDKNANGLQDIGEPGISNVSITLSGQSGTGTNVSLSTNSYNNGFYSFDGLLPGIYSLSFTPLTGYEFTINDKDVLDVLDSDAINGQILNIVVNSGDQLDKYDVGFVLRSSIGDFVWDDLNGNGIQESGEPGIFDVVVNLSGTDIFGNIISENTTTDINGYYLFDQLIPGNYNIQFLTPSEMIATSDNQGVNPNFDSDPTNGFVSDVLVVSDDHRTDIDAGFYKLSEIEGIIWEDKNANGQRESNEIGLPGIQLNITGSNGSIATVSTDLNGIFKINNLVPDVYSLSAQLPASYFWSIDNIGLEDADSDFINGIVDNILIISGTTIKNIDGGMYRKGSIGDFVWEDMNGNGIQDTDEAGIANVNMFLEGIAGDGSSIILNTTSDQTGFYLFDNLPPGNFTLTIDVPDTYLLTAGLQGSDRSLDSDFDGDNKISVNLQSGQNIQTYDAGLVRNISIGDFVWHDKNANGLQDIGEPGISNVSITLSGQSGTGTNVSLSTNSDNNGFYSFDGLLPGIYSLLFTPLTGYEFTISDKDVLDVLDSDAINGQILNIVVNSGDQLDKYDVGFVLRSSIGDFVWDDLNGNGIQDSGEPGIFDVVVNLSGTDIFGNIISENTTTDINGYYLFDQLIPGNYNIQFLTPSEMIATPTNQGANSNLDSDPANGIVSDVLVVSNDHRTDIDAGFYKLSEIEGIIWEDKNANGQRESNEIGLPGIQLNITGSNGSIATVSTDLNGMFKINNLVPDVYSLSAQLPTSYFWSIDNIGLEDTDSDFINGVVDNILIISGTTIKNIDGGMYRKGSIGDFVWEDANFNGLQDIDEIGVKDVVITLNGTDGTGLSVTSSTRSDEAGAYNFDNLVPGVYSVSALLPVGQVFTIATNIDSTLNSDGVQGVVNDVQLCSNDARTDIDFGFVKSLTVGDFVWNDLNVNGIQDAGEPGIADIKLSLVGTTFDGVPVAQSITTGGDGKYAFVGIFPGNYTLEIEIPSSLTPTLAMAGNDRSIDSDLSEALNFIDFTLSTDDLTIDIGLVTLGSIGDLVWEDLNCNGIREQNEPGISGVKVTLEGLDLFNVFVQSSTLTNVNGNYLFSNLKPGQYTVNFETPTGYEFSQAMMNLVEIKSGQNVLNIDASFYRRAALGDFVWYDINENGIQDSNEPGAEGILVSLTGNTFIGQVNKDTITDANGRYYFDNLKPGAYQISVTPPANYKFSIQNVGSDTAIDSDVDINGVRSNIQLISGEMNTSLDAGLSSIANAFIGDYVWEDLNFNGIQDIDEKGISGIEVRLSGIALSGNTIDVSTFTDENGYYGFNDLEAGTYTIQFVTVEPYLYTKQAIGNGEMDSDADPLTGQTNPIIVVASSIIENMDAGLYRRAFIGDFVWHDTNKNGLQDIGESGIQGITIKLLDEQDNVISSTTSLSNGLYFFVNLDPGRYRLEAEVPGTYIPTVENNISLTTNSDFRLQGGKVLTDLFTIISNGNTLNLDLGLVDAIGSISGCAWSDDNGNGLKDMNEVTKSGLKVYLLSSNNDTLAIDTTSLIGEYAFDNLNTGDYTVAFEVIEDSIFTYINVGNDRTIDNDADKFTGKTFNINLLAGQNLSGVNAGYVGYSAIGDFVWRDDNEDGLQTPDEPGINGIKVILLDANGAMIDSTITSLVNGSMRGGYYKFDKLVYDDYAVRFILRQNLNYTISLNNDDDINSDVENFADGTTATFALRPNEINNDIDAGYILTAPVTGVIKGIVWQDANNNKVKDISENTLPDVNISLFDLNATLINTVISGADGSYLFDNVPFGDYYIQTESLNDFVFVKYAGQSLPFDSDISNEFGVGTTRILTVFPGETLDNVDLGYAQKISIGDFVWDDLNHNGVQDAGEPGISAIPVILVSESNITEATTISDINGFYQFTDVPVGRYTLEFGLPEGYLFTKNDNTNITLNSKADQNSGKTTLIDFLVAQTYSDIDAGFVKHGSIGDIVWLDLNGNGIYQLSEPGIADVLVSLFDTDGTKVAETITKTSPNGSFVGYYTFDKVRPGNYYIHFGISNQFLLSPANIGDENTDSNITNANGQNTTDTFTLNVGQQIENIDAGAYLPATLGDFVWNDLNQDGTQDADEPGFSGITVKLFTQAGQLLDTKITDANGKYAFTGLRQRLYYIQFELPDGYQFTQQYNSASGATDSDVDATGTTPLISLAHGSNFLDVDAGIHLTPSKIIMGTVWDDKNEDGIRSENEKFQNNVLVQLRDKQNQVVKTFTTNHAGMYCLSTLDYGEHHVQVISPLSYLFTIKNAGNDRSMDSDVDENGTSDTKMLDNQYEMEYVDAGLYFKLTGKINGMVWIDANGNGIRDAQEATKPNVVIFLFNKNRVFVKSVKTNENGIYSLNNIESGQYYCMIPEFPDMDFVMFTGQNQDKDSEITNQYGLGTSRLITIQGGSTFENFDFGYRPKNGFNIPTPEAREDISVYPNPTIDNINIDLPDGINDASYYIVNSMGSVIQEGKIGGDHRTINTESLISGKFTIHVVTDKTKWIKSFLKIVY
jgi:protocatechuate 3,4-dioxygenase beta subunit